MNLKEMNFEEMRGQCGMPSTNSLLTPSKTNDNCARNLLNHNVCQDDIIKCIRSGMDLMSKDDVINAYINMKGGCKK